MRERARAFVIAEASNPSNRVLFLNLDIGMGDSGIRRGILAELQQQFPGVYSETNVATVGTHQHSGAGGYLENLLPQVTSLGFVNVGFDWRSQYHIYSDKASSKHTKLSLMVRVHFSS